MERMVFSENFEGFRKNAADQNISCELVSGYVVRTAMTGEEGRRLCFILGTMLEDYFGIRQGNDRLCFGPLEVGLDEENIFYPDLITVCEDCQGSNDMTLTEKIQNESHVGTVTVKEKHRSNKDNQTRKMPKLVIEIMSANQPIYDCLDKAVAYQRHGILEYWLIDLAEAFTYTYSFLHGFEYQRYSFEQNIRSQCYPSFACCISELMWNDAGGLKELALFYRFKEEIYPPHKQLSVAESGDVYDCFHHEQYTAEEFYEWLATRKNMPLYANMVELLLGNDSVNSTQSFHRQNIRGYHYFTIKFFLKNAKLPYKIYFAPIAVELKKLEILDCVVVPDLFLMGEDEKIEDNVYHGVPKWVIEIVSPATASQDYIDKAQIYQYHGVSEYWIVNDWKRQVMVLCYGESGDGEDVDTMIYDFEEAIAVRSLDGLEIVMDEVLKLP